MNHYTENPATGNPYRRDYIDGINQWIAKENKKAKETRTMFMPVADFKEKQEIYRSAYHKLLGLDKFPQNATPKFQKTLVAEDNICKIYRATVTLLDTIPFYGLLLVPHTATADNKAPLVICQHGGGGTPELASDFHGKNNYSHLVQRILARGAVVFAPQLLHWNQDKTLETCPKYEVEYNRTQVNVNLKRFGFSITALEIHGISQAITAISQFDFVNEECIGMTGLSYGGYYTLYTTAADPRIKAAYACGCFNDRDVYAWEDMCYLNSANTMQDAEVAALCAPRRLFVSIGKADEVFDYHFGIPEAKRVPPYFEALNAKNNFVFEVWEGGHTINAEDNGIDFLFETFQK